MNDQPILTLEADDYADPLTAPLTTPEGPLVPFVETLPAPVAEQPPAIQEGPGSLLGAIVQLAKDPQVDVTKLDAILKMQERMTERQAEVEFNQAFMRLPTFYVKKNGAIEVNTKEGKKQIRFAKWEDMAKMIEPALAAEGFRLMFNSDTRPGEGGGLIVTGILLHRSGHSKSATMPLPLDAGPGRNNTQATGSTLAYGKRYTAEMLLNVIREGDDQDGLTDKLLTDEQAKQLADKLEELGADEGSFLTKHTNEAHSVEQVMQSDFGRLMNLLNDIKVQRERRGKSA